MSSEQNVPEVQMHQGPPPAQIGNQMGQAGGQIENGGPAHEAGHSVPHGMGQSKSSRRRRRKRKSKSLDASPGGQSGGDAARFVPEIQAGAAQPNGYASPQPQAQNFHGSSQPGAHQGGSSQQGGQQNAGPSTKRWKKKFRERDRQRPQENPGNQTSASSNGSGSGYRDANSHQPGNSAGGFKRKGKQQRGPRSFVGPMDHSYRAVNGNFAETPPSTIESHGNYQPRGGGGRSYVSDSQPIDYSVGRTVPVAADAPTKIFFFIEDLFFNAKITETARKLGVKVAFVKNDKDAIAELTSHEAEADRPGLIVFDLNNANVKPLTLIPKLKAKLKRGTSIIGFLSHLQGDLKAKAVEAGCDTVMPRAAFSQNLPNLLRRYGIHQEEEENFNQ
jgi:hypothetical protein